MRIRIAVATLFGLLACLGILLVSSESSLPDRMATHFGANGLPNGWMTRGEFLRFGALMSIVPVGVLIGIGSLVGKIPPSMINLPNRDYWLAPERRDATLYRLRAALFEFGSAMLAFFVFVIWSVIDANKDGPDARLGTTFVVGLFAFLAFTLVWTLTLVRPYWKVPRNERT